MAKAIIIIEDTENKSIDLKLEFDPELDNLDKNTELTPAQAIGINVAQNLVSSLQEKTQDKG